MKQPVKRKQRIVRYTQEELERLPDRTDWARVDAMTDEDIARQIAEDPDVAPEPTEEERREMRPAREVLVEQFGLEVAAQMLKRKPGQRGRQRTPTKESITLRLDRDVLAHFRAKGAGWQTRINEALRRELGK